MISIIIGIYGEDWIRNHEGLILRAYESAKLQTVPVQVIVSEGNTLAAARNEGARVASRERLVFLDADDTISPDFAEKAIEPEDVLQPLTNDESGRIGYIPPRDSLLDGNHLIVGCPVKKDVFMSVGGFDEWPIYEDWALWLKIQDANGSFGKTTGIYNINYRNDSRNNDSVGPETYHKIRSLYL